MRCPLSAHACIAVVLAQLAVGAPASAAQPAQGSPQETGSPQSDAQEVAAASQLFEQGVEAQQRGDYGGAALSFAQADALVPDPAALEAALSAALLADDPVLGMTLVERSRRQPAPARLARAVESARAKFAGRVGRVTVRCDGCSVTLDAEPMAPNAPRWVEPGEHDIVIESRGGTDRRKLHIDAGSSTDLVPLVASPRAEIPQASAGGAAQPARSVGLSPGWFWIALGVTAAAGGASIASGLDTAAQHESFQKAPTVRAAARGEAAETRTNILVGTTAALGVATACIGLFAVRWGATEAPVEAALAIDPLGAAATVRGAF